MPSIIVPVILAGGSGTRLWPLSRKNYPKQFLCLQGQQSLLQQTVARAKTLATEKILIVANDAHYFLCQEQLNQPSITPTSLIHYLLEPIAHNTAAAIASAALHVLEALGQGAVMLVMPSDHLIKETGAWHEAMLQAVALAQAEPVLVTFGIHPSSPKTGYGYIKAGKKENFGSFRVEAFHEKPTLAKAIQMVADKGHFWNSGMFVAQAQVLINEIQKYAPDILDCSQSALDLAYQHYDFIRLDEAALTACRSESIDYAVMEKSANSRVIPIDIDWSDLGCWDSVAESHDKDESGNTLGVNVIAKDSRNCFVRSEHALVTTLGIQDTIIIATHDAVLVADKNHAQAVKELVNNLQYTHQALLEDHPRVPRPWGHYEILAEGPAFKVKRLMVYPGASLSLQTHQHRAEHWVVVAGKATIINGENELTLGVNQSTYIPVQTRHRLSNKGDTPLYVIEVQSGDYLGEDDIQRLDDIYQRKIQVEV